MISATHWRVRFTAGGLYIWLSELQFLRADKSVVQPNGVALSSGDFSSAYPKEAAFDGLLASENLGWSSASVPAWLGMAFAAPVEVRSAVVRVHPNANVGDRPVLGEMAIESSSDGIAWSTMPVLGRMASSGSVAAGGLAYVFDFVPVFNPVRDLGFVQGRPRSRFTNLTRSPTLRVERDWRQHRLTSGSISDQVVLRTVAGDLPFANGRVWLLRLADGFKAWEGWSDASGFYSATGLEVGVEYVAVGIDPYRNQKATGAGPVVAV